MAKKKPVKAVDDPFANQPPLIDISNRARVLRKVYPEVGQKLAKAIETIAVCRSHNDLLRFLPQHEHEYGCYSKVCGQSAKLLDELATLIYKHLPEVTTPPLTFARYRPAFRHDDKATDWTAFENEMLRIEDAAMVKHWAAPAATAAPAEAPPVADTLARYKQGRPLQRVAAMIWEAELVTGRDEKRRTEIVEEWNRSHHRNQKVKRESVTATLGKLRRALTADPNSRA